LETHEHEGCKTPVFEEYVKMVVWKKAVENGKGHEGIMALVKKKKGHLIQLEREDLNKQFIWFRISENGNIIRIAAQYFAPQVSKTYKIGGLTTKTPLQP
jgi:hypothetical protein